MAIILSCEKCKERMSPLEPFVIEEEKYIHPKCATSKGWLSNVPIYGVEEAPLVTKDWLTSEGWKLYDGYLNLWSHNFPPEHRLAKKFAGYFKKENPSPSSNFLLYYWVEHKGWQLYTEIKEDLEDIPKYVLTKLLQKAVDSN